MEIIPAISTAPNESARLAYAEYLQTPGWRATRDAALKRAKWRCVECGGKRALQVHHLTYERLGQELPGDLAVLCVGCHENKHPEQFETDYLGVYLKLANEVLRSERQVSTVSDFLEALKVRCARLHIPYDTDRFSRAITLTVKKYPDLAVPPVIESVVQAQEMAPISAHDARQFLRRIGLYDRVKAMPAAEPLTKRQYDKLKAAKMVAQEIQESIERCEALEANLAKEAADGATAPESGTRRDGSGEPVRDV